MLWGLPGDPSLLPTRECLNGPSVLSQIIENSRGVPTITRAPTTVPRPAVLDIGMRAAVREPRGVAGSLAAWTVFLELAVGFRTDQYGFGETLKEHILQHGSGWPGSPLLRPPGPDVRPLPPHRAAVLLWFLPTSSKH